MSRTSTFFFWMGEQNFNLTKLTKVPGSHGLFLGEEAMGQKVASERHKQSPKRCWTGHEQGPKAQYLRWPRRGSRPAETSFSQCISPQRPMNLVYQPIKARDLCSSAQQPVGFPQILLCTAQVFCGKGEDQELGNHNLIVGCRTLLPYNPSKQRP